MQDKVTNIVSIAESIMDIVSERFKRGDMSVKDTPNVPRQLDMFFTNIMNSFKQPNGDYGAHLIYIGMPDGKFIGAEIYKGNVGITVRDNSTNWKLDTFTTDPSTLERGNMSHPIHQINAYDPRCRPWYKNTLAYMFESDIWDAFGQNDNFIDFYNDDLPARMTEDCVDSIAYYMDLWNLTTINDTVSMKPNKLYANKVAAKNISYDIVWSQYLFATGIFGLTAAKPITDKITGELLAVIAIDFTLDGLSDYLNATNNKHIDEGDWFAWIFNGDSTHSMIASSDHKITVPSTEIDGCIESAYNATPYLATHHPQRFIRIMSKEIILFYLPNGTLPINTTSEPEHISLPIDLPDALSGRFVTYPFSNDSMDVSLNWVITKSIDIRNFEGKENEDITIIGFILCVLLLSVYFILRTLPLSTIKIKVDKNASSSEIRKQHKEIQSESPEKYIQLLNEMIDMVEGSAAKLWDKKAQIEEYPLSTEIIRDFMARQSNEYIFAANNHNNYALTFCALQVENKWIRLKILTLLRTRSWNSFIIATIFLHLGISLYLPQTRSELKYFDSSTTSARITAALTLLVIFIEMIDVIFHGIKRYIEFDINQQHLLCLTKLKYGFNHEYVRQIENKSAVRLTFFGTAHWKLFLIHICLFLLVLAKTITISIFGKFSIFEYYLPVVPILLLVRCEAIRKFSYRFFYAVYLARDVLTAYFFFIIFAAILGLSVFSEIINPDQSTDSYRSSIRALITSFVFVVTGTNYDAIVHSVINKTAPTKPGDIMFSEIDNTLSIINIFLLVTISMFGLYFFIPIMVHRFELAFKHIHMKSSNRKSKTKINNIIAAFIMLDTNSEYEISLNSFQSLVHSSMISRNVLFADDNKISLAEFTSSLINKSSINVGINPIQCDTSRRQAFLECNWYRRRRSRHYFLLCIIMPSMCIALLRGFGANDSDVLNILVHIAFVFNFADVILRCYSFGLMRYFRLFKYENPPLIQQATYKWHVERGIVKDRPNTVRLSYKAKEWCDNNLHSVIPLSSWNKRKLSAIHKFELVLTLVGVVGFILTFIFPSYLSGYYYLFLQCYLFRLFTLVEYQANQSVFSLVFTITPKFLNLLAFLFIFIFIWARIGCTMFAYKTEYVLDDIYSIKPNVNFNTLGLSIFTLMQLMVGKGWHEVMYLYMIATGIGYSFYFIIYTVVVTTLISNVLIGLFLSEIEVDSKQLQLELENQRKKLKDQFQLELENQRKKKELIIQEQELVIKSLQETDELRKKRILAEVKKTASNRAECAASNRAEVMMIASKPLHRFTENDVCQVIKSWVLNDIIYIENSKKILKIILEQSLSGQKLALLYSSNVEHLSVVLEKAISKYMTASSFDKVINYLTTQIKEKQEMFKKKKETEIAELIIDFALNSLCQQISDDKMNGQKVIGYNTLFQSNAEKETGWDKNDITQINMIILKYKTLPSEKIKSKIYDELKHAVGANIAEYVQTQIQINNMDLPKIQLKIKNGQMIHEEQEIFMNILQELEEQEQKDNKQDKWNLVHEFYHAIAQSLIGTNGWVCFNCNNFNLKQHETDVDICRLCGIKQVASITYALKDIETCAMVNNKIAKTNENKGEEKEEQNQITEIDEIRVNLSCPNSIKMTICHSIKRLSEKLKFYQSWIDQIRAKHNGKDVIEYKADLTQLKNETFKTIMMRALKLTPKANAKTKSEITRLIANNIINITLFATMGRKPFVQLIVDKSTLKRCICTKIYKPARRLLHQHAYTKKFGNFFSEIELNDLVRDYHHILDIHINRGDKETKESVFVYFQHLVRCNSDGCISLKRKAQRQHNLNDNDEIDKDEIDKDKIDNNQTDNAEINAEISVWSMEQSYAQSTMDVIHCYLIHHDCKSDIHIEDEEEHKYSHLQLNEMNQKKYVSITQDNRYGFGVDHDHIHLKSKYECLKDEMLQNQLFVLKLSAFQDLLMKALKNQQIATEQYSLICTHYDTDYNIIRNEFIGIRHILSIVIYTDCSEFCTVFRRTYRLTNDAKTEEDVTIRHRELYWFSRFLFESIESFGKPMPKSMEVYHGLDKVMCFDRFTSYFNQPVSTTTNIVAAQNFSKGVGSILIFKRGSSNNPSLIPQFLDVSWLSAFPNEDERLFYGKNIVFQICDIIKAETMESHRTDLKSLNCFQKCVTNQKIDWMNRKQVSVPTMQHLKQLIQKQKERNIFYVNYINEINDENIDKKENDAITDYGEKLFDFFCCKLKWIGIRNIQTIPSLLKAVLLNDNDKYAISFIGLTVLFPSCQKIILNDLDSKIFANKCENYIMCVVKYIKYINTYKNIDDKLLEIILESGEEIESKPNPTLKKLSKIYSKRFIELKWTIEYQFKLETYHSLSFSKSTQKGSYSDRSIIDATINAYENRDRNIGFKRQKCIRSISDAT